MSREMIGPYGIELSGEKSAVIDFRKTPKLCLRNVPGTMTENGVMNLCAQFGFVRNVFKPQSSWNFYFVTYSTSR